MCVLRSAAQVPANFIGTWDGLYQESIGTDTLRSRCSVTFSRTNGNYISGTVQYTDGPDKQTQKSAGIKAYYAYIDESDQLIYDASTQNQITQKKCKGKMGYKIFTDQRGNRFMRGTFFPDNDNENCNVIRTYLVYKTASDAAMPANGGSRTGGTVSGSVLPQAAVLTVAAIDDFQEGFAVYRKGERFGVTDRYGNDFMPLGKYNFDLKNGTVEGDARCGFHNGMCMVYDVETNKVGYIDTTGKLVIPCLYRNATAFKEDGYCYAEFVDPVTDKYYYYFLDKQGKRFALSNANYREGKDLYFLQSQGTDYKTTVYYRKNGTKAFETKLPTRGYGDGLMLTSQYIDNGVTKTGFIDTTGKLVIPYKYSGELKNFSNGLALYQPKYQDEYQYSFINKSGEDVIKLRRTSDIKDYDDVSDFHSGYATCNIIYQSRARQFSLIDKSGTVTPVEPLFRAANPQLVADMYNNDNFSMSVSPYYFSRAGMIMKCEVWLKENTASARAFYNSKYQDGRGGIGMVASFWISSGYGMMDYSGKMTILPLFADIHPFDETSGLAMAFFKTRDGRVINGFINQNGQFTIIIQKNL